MVAGQSPAEIFSLHDITFLKRRGLPRLLRIAPQMSGWGGDAGSRVSTENPVTAPRRHPSRSDVVRQVTQPGAPRPAAPLPVLPVSWSHPGRAPRIAPSLARATAPRP